MKPLYKEELLRLGLSCDPETGAIYLNGEKIEPVINLGPTGATYPRVYVYDPLRYASTMARLRRAYGSRPISAARVVWAFAYGSAPADAFIRAKNKDPFDLRLENLEAIPRRGPRK